MWIGIYGGLVCILLMVLVGICCFMVVCVCDGLGSDNVVVVLLDVYGCLWVVMVDGLLVIDLVFGVICMLGLCDGFVVCFYNYCMVVIGLEGELMFGGFDGLVVIEFDVLVEVGWFDVLLVIIVMIVDECVILFV